MGSAISFADSEVTLRRSFSLCCCPEAHDYLFCGVYAARNLA